VVKLTQTIADATHELEADKPYLSQVRGIMNGILNQATKWAAHEDTPAELAKGVVEAVQRRYAMFYDPVWSAAYLLDPVYLVRTAAGFMLPFSELSRHKPPQLPAGDNREARRAQKRQQQQQQQGVEERTLLDDAKACIARLAGKSLAATEQELGVLRVETIPPEISDVCEAMVKREKLADGRVQLAPIEHRRSFWLMHIAPSFPILASAAERLLSAHVTTGASERVWSVAGRVFTKSRNRLGLERARKLMYVACNSKAGMKGVDEEVRLTCNVQSSVVWEDMERSRVRGGKGSRPD
jgi:hypothetical protein